MFVLVEADVVEDEEFGFGTEIGDVGQSGGFEVGFGFLGDVARVPAVFLFGHGVDDVADHAEGGNFSEGVEHGGVGVGDDEHVAGVDGLPAPDAGSVESVAVFKGVFG